MIFFSFIYVQLCDRCYFDENFNLTLHLCLPGFKVNNGNYTKTFIDVDTYLMPDSLLLRNIAIRFVLLAYDKRNIRFLIQIQNQNTFKKCSKQTARGL